MFKGPVFIHGAPLSDSEADDSDISLTSTVESNTAEDETYIVDEILAEQEIDGEMRYLVRWEGYPIERCTWEPLRSFAKPDLPLNWKKLRKGPPFDWEKWEEDRAREEEEKEIRKEKRRKKRERLGIFPPGTSRSPSPPPDDQKAQREQRQQYLKRMSKLRREKRGAWSSSSSSASTSYSSDSSDFIVDDDHISIEDSDEDLAREEDPLDDRRPGRRAAQGRRAATFRNEDLADSDTDPDGPKQTRGTRRRSRQKPDEKAEKAPQDTGMVRQPNTRKNKAGADMETRKTKPPRKQRIKERDTAKSKDVPLETEKSKPVPPIKLAGKRDPAQPASAKQVPAKRRLSPTATNPPKTRVRKLPPVAAPDTGSADGPGQDDSRTARRSKQKPKFFDSLAARSRANKFKDRAPSASQLSLFRPGDAMHNPLPKPFSKLSLGAGAPQKRKPSLEDPVTEETNPNTAPTIPGQLRPILKRPPSRQSSISGLPRPAKAVEFTGMMDIDEPAEKEDKANAEPVRPGPLQLPELKKLKLDDLRNMQPHKFIAREGPPSAQISPLAPMMSPAAMTPMFSPTTASPKTIASPFFHPPRQVSSSAAVFEALLVFGDRQVNMGVAIFEGFTTEFIDLLNHFPDDNKKLHISRSLETAYICKYFVPEMGPPLEHAEISVHADLCDSFRSSLTIFQGAGVVLHAQFTLIVFLANNDALRKAFGTPQGQKKSPLRAVAYPPLDPSVWAASAAPFSGLAPLDDGFKHYHPNLYQRIFGLDLVSYGISTNGIGSVQCCIIYAPPLAVLEQTELETLLKLHGVQTVMDYTGIPEWVAQPKRPETRILVHASLKNKLHLLPHIAPLLRVSHGLSQLQWHFFGLMYEPSRTPNLRGILPSRFWVFGTVILLTTEFVIRHLDALRTVLNYCSKKSVSTLMCIPSYLLQRVIKYSVQHLSTPNSGAIEVVALASELDRKAQTAAASSSFGIEAGVIYLPHLSSPRVTEIESFADAFILFQQNNMSYRKFIICHADNERISQELYGSISLYDAHTTLRSLGPSPGSDTVGNQ